MKGNTPYRTSTCYVCGQDGAKAQCPRCHNPLCDDCSEKVEEEARQRTQKAGEEYQRRLAQARLGAITSLFFYLICWAVVSALLCGMLLTIMYSHLSSRSYVPIMVVVVITLFVVILRRWLRMDKSYPLPPSASDPELSPCSRACRPSPHSTLLRSSPPGEHP